MKTTRILSLLFSLCQFLLFLKFVELVQGDIILHSEEKSNNNTQEDSYVDSDGTITFNKTQSDRIDLLADDNLNNSTSSSESSSGRLCPGCEGGTCGATTVSSYRFPGIQVLIALAVGVIWFFAFLFLFYFMIDPSTAKPGYPPSSGYGYGGGHDGWAQSGSSTQGGFGGISSLLSMFTGNQRSFNYVNSLTSHVLNALNSFTQNYAT